ncbi:Choline/ethanolaminephosphotransferase 1 [Linum perenne]
MLLMGSKHGELTLPVHWASCLTMDVMLLHVHYFTNTLILPVVNGPTEGLMLIYLAYFFTAIVGAEWWSQDFGQCLPIVSWVPFVSEVPTFKAVLYLMIAFAVIPTIGSNVMNVNKVVQARKGGISMALALAMIYPFMVLMGGILVCQGNQLLQDNEKRSLKNPSQTQYVGISKPTLYISVSSATMFNV